MQDKLKYGVEAHRTMGFRGESPAADTRPRDVVTGEPINTWWSSRERESGQRVKITAVLPSLKLANLQNPSTIEYNLGKELSDRYGGFSVREQVGGWVENGELLIEAGLVFDVSFVHAPGRVDKVRELFTVAGLLAGQTWVHIEQSKIEALHTKAQ